MDSMLASLSAVNRLPTMDGRRDLSPAQHKLQTLPLQVPFPFILASKRPAPASSGTTLCTLSAAGGAAVFSASSATGRSAFFSAVAVGSVAGGSATEGAHASLGSCAHRRTQPSFSTMSGKSNDTSSATGSQERSGTNDQGNRYNTPSGTNSGTGNSYHYSNTDGSYYNKNDNGSKYYSDPSGHGHYTAPPSKK